MLYTSINTIIVSRRYPLFCFFYLKQLLEDWILCRELSSSPKQWAQLSRIISESGDRSQSPERCVLNTRRTLGDPQKHNKCMYQCIKKLKN
jgi:hypothetical protein